MSIDWKAAQTRLTAAGYNAGPVDGQPGRITYGALFGFTAKRQPDEILRELAGAAVVGLPDYGLTATPERLCEFLAQTSIESGSFSRFEENMRYSARRLMAVWPSRFPTLTSALPYAWDAADPDAEDAALANLVYGSRMGNQRNGTADGDGWKFRGRGILQLTGYDNYALYGPRVGIDLIAHPERAAAPGVSLKIACAFWKAGQANAYVDRGDFYGARGIINAGTPRPRLKPHGLDEVAASRRRLLTLFA